MAHNTERAAGESPRRYDTIAYPDALRSAEEDLLRRKHGAGWRGRTIGVGVSGGGIRSATFSLGAMQWLARRGFLGRIDFLSTVSGGGYLGAFLGRLFTRKARDEENGERPLNADEVGLHLDPCARCDPPLARRGAALGWLRENGRYLAPKGAGDLLLGGAVLVRNLLSLHLVMFVALLTVWLLLQGVRELAALGLARFVDLPAAISGLFISAGNGFLWWSPWLLLPLAVVLLFVAPAATGYWVLLHVMRRRQWSWSHCMGLLASGFALGALGVARASTAGDNRYALGLGVVLAGAALVLGLGLVFAWVAVREGAKLSEQDQPGLFVDSYARHWISDQQSSGMQLAALFIALALVDSLGQSVYRASFAETSLGELLFGAVGSALALGIAARRILVTLGGHGGDDRLSVPVGLLAQAAGMLLALLLLLVVNVVSHAVIWGFDPPAVLPGGELVRLDTGTAIHALMVLALAMAVTVFFGRQARFINSSTHQPLYTARLTRAYLGASNPARIASRGPEAAVTRVVDGDDIPQEEYWPGPEQAGERWRHAPLHYVNVTINETVDGLSQVQQQDRKGTGLAIGPCGMSVGIRHHLCSAGKEPEVYPKQGFQVFAAARDSEKTPAAEADRPRRESLSLGKWIGISGAAFSTGLGARTNLGLSLLLGLANVRLGYWWNSGIQRSAPKGEAGDEHIMAKGENLLRRNLPVYARLLDELTARFRGTAHTHWYLSDGGHFENLGGYELIRRRPDVMILLDAEADPDYEFDGLAGLVRKARMDFNAEIRFLDEEELDALLEGDVRRQLGTLAELKRGRWANEPFDEPALKTRRRPRQTLDPADRRRYSRAHAALARVHYLDCPETKSWLLYIKATMTGDEPTDLLEYHATNPDFPHQTTADQFFDEAQWESYRRLGEHVLSRLFPEDGPAGPVEPGKRTLEEICWSAGSSRPERSSRA